MQNPLSSSAYLLFTLLLFSQAFSAICQTHGSFRINNLRMMMPGRSLDSDSSDRIPNFTSDYIDLMIASDYYGRWASTNNLKGMDVIPPGFDNPNGLAVLNPYEAGADLVLLDSENIDGNFYFIFFNYNDLFQDISSHNGLMKVVNISATYWKGDDLLRQGNVSAETCVVDELTVTVLNAETNKPFNPIEDKERDAVIQVIAVSKECPLNFETTLMTPYDERFKSQRWVYSLIYLVWCIPNIIVGLRKFRDLEDIDKIQGAQFFLIFNINFYLSMWNNAFAQEFAGTVGLILVALLNLFIWSSNFGTSFRCIQGRRNPCFLAGSIFFTIIMRIVYTYSHGVLLATFIAIVLIDIIRHFRMQGRLNYDVSLYLGMLLPSLVTVAYLTLYDQNFARISAHPELTQFFIIFLFLAFGVLPIQIEIKRFIRKMQREKRFINTKNINPEDVCPICMQTLVPPEPKSDSEDLTDVIVEPKDDENPQLNPAPVENKSHQKQPASRVLKTVCGHMFHESCLTEWIRIKPECPTCRKAIVDFI